VTVKEIVENILIHNFRNIYQLVQKKLNVMNK
jgi:hypothetical protein